MEDSECVNCRKENEKLEDNTSELYKTTQKDVYKGICSYCNKTGDIVMEFVDHINKENERRLCKGCRELFMSLFVVCEQICIRQDVKELKKARRYGLEVA